MKQSKIAVIGAGSVGSTTAYALLLKNIAAHVMLVDIDEVRCRGEILDLSDAISFSESSQAYSATLQQAALADIVIIAAGKKQDPGQPRTQLAQTNSKIVTDIITKMHPIQKNAIIILVTNPVDITTLCAQKVAHLPQSQVFGSGTLLDTQRLRGLLAKKLHVAEQSIDAYVLGEHGDSQFVAWSSAHVAGTPILEFGNLTEKSLKKIAQETKNRAQEIIACKGATYYGIAACVANMCESILFDQKTVMPLSIFNKEFNVCLSLPVVLGAKGIKQTVPMQLNEQEAKALQNSAQTLQKIAC